ncbi:MAG: DNA polymerase III subunit delta [Acidimicrobiales bacterium]
MTAAVRTDAHVYLVRGDDPSLVRDAVVEVVGALVGERDRVLTVEEVQGDDFELGVVVDAARTPPFLSDRRVLVVRDAGRFGSADAVAPLVTYLADPLPTTALVLVWGSGRIPKPLTEAVNRAGGVQVDTAPGRDQRGWVAEHLAESGLRFDNAARQRIMSRLGEDVARLRGILETLESAFGPGARLGEDDVAPYLGEAGVRAPYEFTDAIDRGDIPLALDRLHRMLEAGERHSLQVMATLHFHFWRMLALDGADVASEREAAELLAMDPRRSTYPAKKALQQVRRLGHDRIARAVRLLGQADLDLRGAKAWPDHLVMEVLVARLAALARR